MAANNGSAWETVCQPQGPRHLQRVPMDQSLPPLNGIPERRDPAVAGSTGLQTSVNHGGLLGWRRRSRLP